MSDPKGPTHGAASTPAPGRWTEVRRKRSVRLASALRWFDREQGCPCRQELAEYCRVMVLADFEFKFAYRQCAFDKHTRHYINLPFSIKRSFAPPPGLKLWRGEIASASTALAQPPTTDREAIRFEGLRRQSRLPFKQR